MKFTKVISSSFAFTLACFVPVLASSTSEKSSGLLDFCSNTTLFIAVAILAIVVIGGVVLYRQRNK